jgi:hypothetical protein
MVQIGGASVAGRDGRCTVAKKKERKKRRRRWDVSKRIRRV